ncbi:50S ribosomal protein L3 [Patescibacteria group bacterium]|nr:50S ribosomal protein L3 [Patescibacteria group bacterium]
MKFILGKKLGMSRKFQEDGTVVPVTLVEAGPCVIVQIKTEKKDGYNAVQVGFGKKKNVTKPEKGHVKDLETFRYLREFRADGVDAFKRGDEFTVAVFTEGDEIKVTGISIGKGFQGVVKRHGFHGSPATHGHKDQLRMPGSIGSAYPEHVRKGKRMGGQMGNQQATITNLKVVSVDIEKNQLAIKGGIPGPTNNLVLIYGEGEMVMKQEKNEDMKKEVKPETKQETPKNNEKVTGEPKESVKTAEKMENPSTRLDSAKRASSGSKEEKK